MQHGNKERIFKMMRRQAKPKKKPRIQEQQLKKIRDGNPQFLRLLCIKKKLLVFHLNFPTIVIHCEQEKRGQRAVIFQIMMMSLFVIKIKKKNKKSYNCTSTINC